MGERGMTHTYRSKEFKLNIVKEVLGGKSSREVGKGAGISDSLCSLPPHHLFHPLFRAKAVSKAFS